MVGQGNDVKYLQRALAAVILSKVCGQDGRYACKPVRGNVMGNAS